MTKAVRTFDFPFGTDLRVAVEVIEAALEDEGLALASPAQGFERVYSVSFSGSPETPAYKRVCVPVRHIIERTEAQG